MAHTCKTKISCSQGVCEYIADEKTTDKCCPTTAFADDEKTTCQNDSNQKKCIHQYQGQSPGHDPSQSTTKCSNNYLATQNDDPCWNSVGDCKSGNICPSGTPDSGNCTGGPGYGCCSSSEGGPLAGCKLQGNQPSPPQPQPSPSPHQPSQPPPPPQPPQNSHHKVAVQGNKVVVENTDGSNQKTLISVTPSSVMLNTSGVSGDANSVTPVNLSHLLKSNGWGTASDFSSPSIPVEFCDPSCKCKVGQCGDSMLLVGLAVGVPLLLVIIGMAIGMRKGKKGKKSKK